MTALMGQTPRIVFSIASKAYGLTLQAFSYGTERQSLRFSTCRGSTNSEPGAVATGFTTLIESKSNWSGFDPVATAPGSELFGPLKKD